MSNPERSSEKFCERTVSLKNGQSLRLREARPEDAPFLLSYLNEVGGESDNLLFGENEWTLSKEKEEQFIQSQRQAEKALMLLGFMGEELVLVSSLSAFFLRARIAHRAELALSVRKAFWGLGIGRRAMEALLDFSREIGVEIVELQVKADNERGVRLYESMGFEKIGTYRRFFKINGVYFDAYLMNRYL